MIEKPTTRVQLNTGVKGYIVEYLPNGIVTVKVDGVLPDRGYTQPVRYTTLKLLKENN
jgi:hypothetical protein